MRFIKFIAILWLALGAVIAMALTIIHYMNNRESYWAWRVESNVDVISVILFSMIILAYAVWEFRRK